jgi:hemin uptake protein HemP
MSLRALRRSDPLAMNRAQAKLALKTVATEPLDTGVLFAGSSEVVITHGAEVYRLRLTRQNKLILTK